MTAYEFNIVLNCITAVICGSASIDSRVHNKTIGAILLSIGSIGSILNMVRPDFFGLLPLPVAIGLNSLVAVIAIYWRVTWRDPRKHDRELFKDLKR